MSNDTQASGDIELVTPSDTDGFGRPTRAVSFGTAGALSVVCAWTGDTVAIPSGALSAGATHAIAVTRINSTGTTAADIVAYF